MMRFRPFAFIFATGVVVGASASIGQVSPGSPEIKRVEPGYITNEEIANSRPMAVPELSERELKLLNDKSEMPLALPKADPLSFGLPANANVAMFPYSAAGKLWTLFPGSTQWEECSAQFVGGNNMLLTAAHCVRKGDGTWAIKGEFIRAFDNGGGERVALECWTTWPNWVTDPFPLKYRWDYAFIRTRAPSNAGFFGLNPAQDLTFEAIGYPHNFATGKHMQKVTGSRGPSGEGQVRMEGNPFQDGASGGAWHVNGVVMGNNSRFVRVEPTRQWSPLYDSNVAALWRHLHGLPPCTTS